ncbi:MAG: hypothetical protein ACJAXS_003403, partial [Colwellia sp.]
HEAVGINARAYIESERQWQHNAAQLLSLVSLDINRDVNLNG